MNLIDADALHNSLRNKQKWVVRSFYGEKYNEGYTYDQVPFAIDDTPTVEPMRWIPVEERLPEKYGQYLVTISPVAGRLWDKVAIVHYSDLMGICKAPVFWAGNVGKADFENVTELVTAWMPLPEPYKEWENHEDD